MAKQGFFVFLIAGLITLIGGFVLHFTESTSHGSSTVSHGINPQHGEINDIKAWQLGVGILILAVVWYFMHRNDKRNRKKI